MSDMLSNRNLNVNHGYKTFFTHHGEKLRRLAKGFTNVTPDAPRDTATNKWPNGKYVFSGICDAEDVVQSCHATKVSVTSRAPCYFPFSAV